MAPDKHKACYRHFFQSFFQPELCVYFSYFLRTQIESSLSANSAYSILFARTIHFTDEECSSYNLKILGKLTLLIRFLPLSRFSKENPFSIDNFIKQRFIYFERNSSVFRFYRYVTLYISGSCRVSAGGPFRFPGQLRGVPFLKLKFLPTEFCYNQ